MKQLTQQELELIVNSLEQMNAMCFQSEEVEKEFGLTKKEMSVLTQRIRSKLERKQTNELL
jgi:hypothetical protein|tara:strand:- start:1134 stop:1316 length:183 start_codon:yes stop_codon:yes gene_type:complete